MINIPALLARLKVSRGEGTDRYYVASLFGFGLFIHHIHHADPEGVYHSHPWNSVSFIVLGKYVENFYGAAGFDKVCRWFNYIRANWHHRVTPIGNCWTLFLHGRRCNKWSVINMEGQETYEPFRGPGVNRSMRQK